MVRFIVCLQVVPPPPLLTTVIWAEDVRAQPQRPGGCQAVQLPLYATTPALNRNTAWGRVDGLSRL